MKTKKYLLLFVSVLLWSTGFTQGVAINATGAAPSSRAILDISSTTKGLLIPRMTGLQRTSMISPPTGLMVYDTDQNAFFYAISTGPMTFTWRKLVNDVQNNSLRDGDGDSKIDFYYNSTHDDSLYIIFQNTEKYRITARAIEPLNNDSSVYIGEGTGTAISTGNRNVALGYKAGFNNESGYDMIAIGHSALSSGEGTLKSIAIGTAALKYHQGAIGNIGIGDSSMMDGVNHTGGDYNIAIGPNALKEGTNFNSNIAIGAYAMEYIQGTSSNPASDKSYNVAIGYGAMRGGDLTMYANLYKNNTAIGYQAMENAQVASSNVAVGYKALRSTITTGGDFTDNVAVGANALYSNNGNGNTALGTGVLNQNNTGHSNTAAGMNAMFYNTTGKWNSAFGSNTLQDNQTGDNNTAMGYRSLYTNKGNHGSTAVGYYAMRYADDRASGRNTYNTAIGYKALMGSATAANNTGQYNTVVGDSSLSSNTSGSYNTALGCSAMPSNTTGSYSTSIGFESMINTTTGGSNLAVGYRALFSNVGKRRNTVVGIEAMYYADNTTSTTDTYNTAIGYKALRGSSTAASNTGTGNTAVGDQAMFNNTSGSDNVALGKSALDANTTGSNNTAIGSGADVSTGALTNATAIGYNATVNASNKVRIGNSSVAVIEGQVAYTYPSDARFKRNVQPGVAGLEFIKRLNPVVYQFDNAAYANYIGEEVADNNTAPISGVQMGLLAQDVEKVCHELNVPVTNFIHAPSSDQDTYSMSYSTLVVPLIQAVQEQQAIIEELRREIEELKAEGRQDGLSRAK